MRLIGHLPDERAATTFSDFLLVNGVVNQVEPENDGWALWIYSEDDLKRASGMLESFLANPTDPKYGNHSRQARRLRQQEQREAEEAEKRYFDRTRLVRATIPYGVGPLTLALIVASSAIWVYMQTTESPSLFYALIMSKYRQGLKEILAGEVWRLFTPVLLHSGVIHLLFNMLWLFDLGSMIEGRQGTGRLLALVLVTAVLSNLGQFFIEGANFGGMSGVVYGLLGYIWMKGKYDPLSGLFLHPQTVTMMLIWFVICFTGMVGNIANGAHAVGLGVGVAWGYLASRWR